MPDIQVPAGFLRQKLLHGYRNRIPAFARIVIFYNNVIFIIGVILIPERNLPGQVEYKRQLGMVQRASIAVIRSGCRMVPYPGCIPEYIAIFQGRICIRIRIWQFRAAVYAVSHAGFIFRKPYRAVRSHARHLCIQPGPVVQAFIRNLQRLIPCIRVRIRAAGIKVFLLLCQYQGVSDIRRVMLHVKLRSFLVRPAAVKESPPSICRIRIQVSLQIIRYPVQTQYIIHLIV